MITNFQEVRSTGERKCNEDGDEWCTDDEYDNISFSDEDVKDILSDTSSSEDEVDDGGHAEEIDRNAIIELEAANGKQSGV